MLSVIQRPIDNTAMNAYMTCPKEYQYSMVEHRRGRGRSPALVFGSAWHAAMEAHYRTGGDLGKVAEAIYTKWEGHDSADDYRTVDRVLLEYNRYVAHWRPTDADFRSTLGYPDEPMVELATNIAGGGLIHPYAGKLDRIYKEGGLTYIEDHKTTSRLDKHYFSQYKLSNQMKGYTFMGQQLLPGEKVVGVRINLLHVLTNKSGFERQIFTFTPEEIQDWVENTNRWTRRIADDTATGDFPMHFGDNGCSRKFGMCQYHNVCSLSPRLRPKMLEREFDIHPWNPLEADTLED